LKPWIEGLSAGVIITALANSPEYWTGFIDPAAAVDAQLRLFQGLCRLLDPEVIRVLLPALGAFDIHAWRERLKSAGPKVVFAEMLHDL